MNTASDDHHYEGGVEYAAAIAAAAFAITMLDSSNRDEELQNIGSNEATLGRIGSQKDTFGQTRIPDSQSESSSDEETTVKSGVEMDSSKPESHDGNELPEKIIHPVPSTRRRARFAVNVEENLEEIGSMKPKMDNQLPSFPPSPPPIKRRPTFSLSNQDFEEIENIKPKSAIRKPSIPPPPPSPTRRRPSFSLSKNFEEFNTHEPVFPPPPYPPPPPPPPPPPVSHTQKFPESEADAWERAELDKIKKRYEELNLTIAEWEDRRKRKAKGKLDRTEGDSGKKRAKALQAYQDDIERIRQITVGARAQAKEKQRNEELKIKAKADKYRVTGQPPSTCLCF